MPRIGGNTIARGFSSPQLTQTQDTHQKPEITPLELQGRDKFTLRL